MTRDEQLKATAQEDVVAHNRKTYEHNIDQLVEKLKLELEGALEYENFLRHNPYYTDENTSLRNSEALNDIYKAVVNLPLVYFEYSNGQYGVDLEKEGY